MARRGVKVINTWDLARRAMARPYIVDAALLCFIMTHPRFPAITEL